MRGREAIPEPRPGRLRSSQLPCRRITVGFVARRARLQRGTAETLPQLLLVTVRVSWAVGLTEQAVTRTSFAYDATAAIDALAAADVGEDDATEDLTDDEGREEAGDEEDAR